MLAMFARASAKMIATFVVMVAFFLLCLLYFPGAIVSLQDFSQYLETEVRNPPIDDVSKSVYRMLVNDGTILGVLATIIARLFVEIVSWIGGSLWALRKGDEALPASDPYAEV